LSIIDATNQTMKEGKGLSLPMAAGDILWNLVDDTTRVAMQAQWSRWIAVYEK
jgi:hypothetical protein